MTTSSIACKKVIVFQIQESDLKAFGKIFEISQVNCIADFFPFWVIHGYTTLKNKQK